MRTDIVLKKKNRQITSQVEFPTDKSLVELLMEVN